MKTRLKYLNPVKTPEQNNKRPGTGTGSGHGPGAQEETRQEVHHHYCRHSNTFYYADTGGPAVVHLLGITLLTPEVHEYMKIIPWFTGWSAASHQNCIFCPVSDRTEVLPVTQFFHTGSLINNPGGLHPQAQRSGNVLVAGTIDQKWLC